MLVGSLGKEVGQGTVGIRHSALSLLQNVWSLDWEDQKNLGTFAWHLGWDDSLTLLTRCLHLTLHVNWAS